MAKVWAESRHSGTHLLMLLAIADFADDEGNAYPSVATLAQKCRMKPRNANVILAALKASEELQVRLNEGPGGSNRYRITLPSMGVQGIAGVQERAGVQKLARTPAKVCPKPLQGIADEPSMNHQDPPRGAAPAPFELPSWIPAEAWAAWLEMRKAKKKSPTERAKAMVIKTLDQLRSEGHDPEAVLDQSTRNNWTDVFPLKSRQATPQATASVNQLPADEQLMPE